MQIRVLLKRLRNEAGVPSYAHGPVEDAGVDLAYCGDAAITLAPGSRAAFPTGIAIELPIGFEGQIRSRSGLALNRGLVVLNAPGTVDPGFRGEIVVILINMSEGSRNGAAVRANRAISYCPLRYSFVRGDD